jgi:hypothetical protein
MCEHMCQKDLSVFRRVPICSDLVGSQTGLCFYLFTNGNKQISVCYEW